VSREELAPFADAGLCQVPSRTFATEGQVEDRSAQRGIRSEDHTEQLAVSTAYIDQFPDSGEVIRASDGWGDEPSQRHHRFVERRGVPQLREVLEPFLHIPSRQLGLRLASPDRIDQRPPRVPEEPAFQKHPWLEGLPGASREIAAQRGQLEGVLLRLRAKV